MSVLSGGIFSNPRGKTAGIVFGSARTRTGKKVTARQLVPPSNPQSPAQTTQRGKFAESLAIVRLLGASVYQSDFNRSIGQLPGFQSMESIFLNNMDDSFILSNPPSINLGSLHTPDTLTVVAGTPSGSVDITFSTENGLNGLPTDTIRMFAVATNPNTTPLTRVVKVPTSVQRSTGASITEVTGFASGEEVLVMLWAQGFGSTAGMLSPTISTLANAKV